MKVFYLSIIPCLLWPSLACSAQVFGTLKGDHASGTKIEIKCSQEAYSGVTDKHGSYNIYVPEKGKCNLMVQAPGNPSPYGIYSYDDPVRYDFELLRSGGQLQLRRR